MSDLNLLAELDWCPACHGADWEPGDRDLCDRHSEATEGGPMSTDHRYTDADVETVARIHAAGWGLEPREPDREMARAVLDALTAPGSPLVARIRAQVAEQIAQAIKERRERANAHHYRAGLSAAYDIVRAHTTTRGGDHG